MNPRPTYREYLPSPVLRTYVACYWTFGCTEGPGPGRLHRVIPDACMDVLFSLGEGSGDALPGEPDAATRVVGTMTRSLEFQQQGPLDLFGVRFRPGGAIPFVNVPAYEVTDDHIDLSDVWGMDANVARERLAATDNAAGRMEIIEEILKARLSRARTPADVVVLASARWIEISGGVRPVSELEGLTGVGIRQLQRRFQATVGISPKTAARVFRLQTALAHLGKATELPLAHVAIAAGYHDQAHFARDFRDLVGTTPGAYRRARSSNRAPPPPLSPG